MKMIAHPALRPVSLAIAALLVATSLAQASSHREAPSVAGTPRVDASDFYMFTSYEGVAANGSGGRSAYVTLIANYLPLQDPYGGPNFYSLDPNALYEIHIDNNGDAREDITFQFRFKNTLKSTPLNIGGTSVPIPLIQSGPVSGRAAAALNLNESFTLDIVRGDRRTGTRQAVTNTTVAGTSFDKPVDNIGTKTIADYPAYANQHIYAINIPGCATAGKVFVGQRKDPFAVNLGTIFDLVNTTAAVITNPANINAAPNSLAGKNVTTLALEVPKTCLTQGTETVIGGWTTSSLRQGALLNPTPALGHQTAAKTGGAWTQVSRLGMPLVNEVVIGLPAKDRFNASKPSGDAQFASYVTNPTLPALIQAVLPGALAPTNLPRTDLVTTFLTGIAGVNKPANVVTAEMLRLNTATAAVPEGSQNRLGVVGEIVRVGGAANLAAAVDLAGYPNGRRPKDDVVDISLIAVMGGLCTAGANGTTNALQLGTACAPSAVPMGNVSLQLHDAVDQAVVPLLPTFPYLAHPLPGAQ